MGNLIRCGLLWACCFMAQTAVAHEFWIDPARHVLEPGDVLAADLRVGEMFTGSAYPYFVDNFLLFEAGPVGALAPVRGRTGDLPALSLVTDAPGLWLVAYEPTPRWVTYDAWDRFVLFTDTHGLDWAQAAHRDRGLPEAGFREVYDRHAKALVAVGDATEGRDRRLGLAAEIVAETNPYALSGGGHVLLRMYQDGAPRAGGQLDLFLRGSDGTVTRHVHHADDAGRVTVVVPAGTEVMASFTTLAPVPGDPAAREAVWHSRWASLSFAVP
ncbi:DUF4198 domain-containing protein [Meridianimarinicoccus sp. RP-17]|uniref:DUF4198 domain-containing protein n=1 Tax=Meridianimarinicoccus zhengii TaxID=2056810 RepID=UPI0013A6AA41|nr:DUF4198 domain-containing protein [Phycocomes zhengii]